MGRYETGSFISSNNIFQNSNEVLQLLFLFYHDTHKSLTHKHATAPLSVFTIFFISTTCTPYTQLPSSIIPFSPAYRQSPKLSTVTVHAYVPINGNSEEEIKEPLLPKKEEIPAYPLHKAVLLNPLYRFLFFICVDFSQKYGYNIL